MLITGLRKAAKYCGMSYEHLRQLASGGIVGCEMKDNGVYVFDTDTLDNNSYIKYFNDRHLASIRAYDAQATMAKLYNIPQAVLAKAIDSGEIQYRRVGTRKLIRHEDMVAYITHREDEYDKKVSVLKTEYKTMDKAARKAKVPIEVMNGLAKSGVVSTLKHENTQYIHISAIDLVKRGISLELRTYAAGQRIRAILKDVVDAFSSSGVPYSEIWSTLMEKHRIRRQALLSAMRRYGINDDKIWRSCHNYRTGKEIKHRKKRGIQ